MSNPLGSLERIDPRLAWAKEDGHFTPWLASPEGLKLLGDTLGYGFERVDEEHAVGPFKADILARRTDTPDEHWVVIENQLEKTDHSHLGQLLTYAAGKEARTVIWVATKFVDEHRAAIDWLNTISGEAFEFFALEIELWRIGNSAFAPKLNIVARPNDWSRAISEAKKADGVGSPFQEQQRRYWATLAARIVSTQCPVKPQKPMRQAWAYYALGRTGIVLCATTNTISRFISVECHMNGNTAPAWFAQLQAQQAQIEQEIGSGVEWDQKEGRDVHKVMLRKPNTDSTNEADWPAQHDWITAQLSAFAKAFGSRAKQLVGPANAPDES